MKKDGERVDPMEYLPSPSGDVTVRDREVGYNEDTESYYNK